MRRFFKWLGYAFLGLIAAGVILYVEPFLNTHAYQDDCSFGSVSNDEYRALLAEAERMNDIEPLKFDFSTPESQERQEHNSALLQDRVNSLVGTQRSLDGKVAALHAVMRSIGARYLYTGKNYGYAEAVFQEGVRHSEVVYRFDVNQFGRFVVWPRWIMVKANVNLKGGVESLGDMPFRIVVLQPTIIDGDITASARSPYGESCPSANAPETPR